MTDTKNKGVPSCFSNGKTIEEDKRNIGEAVQWHP